VTGGIACGKSSVSRMLKDLGARVVDADVLARRVVEPGKPAYRDIVKTFGKQVLKPDGTLDRKRLGRIVFSDGDKLRQLNQITHPRIASAAKREIARHRRSRAPLVVYDAALLVEKGWHRGLDGLVVVSVPERVQLQRMMQRDGFSKKEAMQRIRSQLPQSAKLKVADHVIDNSGTPDQTRQQVRHLWQDLVAGPR
jgi:dephospho-CoA kinase